MRRIVSLVEFILLFIFAFLKANISVAWLILTVKKSRITPQLTTYDASMLTHAEMLFIAQLITLTPGTIVTDIDEQEKKLTVHVLNTTAPEKAFIEFDKWIKNALLKVTR